MKILLASLARRINWSKQILPMKTNWEIYKVGDEKYDRRFLYYRQNVEGAVFYKRETKKWYKLIEKFGFKLRNLVYFLHDKFGKRRTLTEKQKEEAKRLANQNVSEKEYLDRFSRVNPYVEEPYSTILWWIRKNITFD